MVRLLPDEERLMHSDLLGTFNPTMVRLLPEKRKQLINMAATFQSHNGAIAALRLNHQR